MPTYDFVCEECRQEYEIVFRMSDDEGRKNVTCVKCGSKLKRKFGKPAVIVKGTINQVLSNLAAHQTVIDHDGQPIRLNFIDHGERSQVPDGSIGKFMPGARMDEKSGKMVVDVRSNVPDPLGRVERMKREHCKSEKTVHKVGQPYKVRRK